MESGKFHSIEGVHDMQLKPRIMSDYKPYCCVRPRNVKYKNTNTTPGTHEHDPSEYTNKTPECVEQEHKHTPYVNPPSPPQDGKKLMGFEPTTPT